MRSPVRLPRALSGRTAAVATAGVVTAMISAGTASAATIASTSTAHSGSTHVAAASAHRGSAGSSVRATGKRAGTSRHGGSGIAAHVVTASAKPSPAAKPGAPAKPGPAPAPSWNQIQQQVASQTSPAEGSGATTLQPVSPTGPQTFMPLSASQQANATTIVQQALAKKMGLRSAVIAVATSMQESQLQNINYGTSDSLGLFQQRPSMGWGTAQQILTPSYSADAFLTALQQYQASNPGWATQPLWTSAQGVQKSGVPTAYAQWESQAAHLVQQIVTQVK